MKRLLKIAVTDIMYNQVSFFLLDGVKRHFQQYSSLSVTCDRSVRSSGFLHQ